VWFYALDICEALDIKNPRDALGRLDDDEKRTVGSADTSVLASRTNPQIINESGLYNLIFQSRKDEAKRFRKWVTSDVLPKIPK
jgi:prophage antirepressor-like protein